MTGLLSPVALFLREQPTTMRYAGRSFHIVSSYRTRHLKLDLGGGQATILGTGQSFRNSHDSAALAGVRRARAHSLRRSRTQPSRQYADAIMARNGRLSSALAPATAKN